MHNRSEIIFLMFKYTVLKENPFRMEVKWPFSSIEFRWKLSQNPKFEFILRAYIFISNNLQEIL